MGSDGKIYNFYQGGIFVNSKTLIYILKRLVLAILTIWVVITITFFVMRAVPGGPFASEKALSEAAQASLEAKYGLDKPLFTQYVTYLKDIVLRFDFGPSLTQRGRNVIGDCYIVRNDTDIKDIVFQEGETVDAKWVTLPELDKMIEEGLVAPPVSKRLRKIRKDFENFIYRKEENNE